MRLQLLLVLVVLLPGAFGEAADQQSLDSKSFNGELLTIMTVEDPPFVSIRGDPFNASSEVLPQSEWSGWVIDLIKEVAELGDFRFKLKVAEEGPTFSYAEAFQEGKKNDADLYWAGAYLTPGRLNETFATSSFAHSPLALAVPAYVDSGGLAQRFGYVFKPFTSELIYAILLVVTFGGCFYAFIEPMNHNDFQVRGTARSLHSCLLEMYRIMQSVHFFSRPWELFFPERVKSFDDRQRRIMMQKRHLLWKILSDAIDVVVHSLYIGFVNFLGQDGWQPYSWAGKAFHVAWSLFAVIVISACVDASPHASPHASSNHAVPAHRTHRIMRAHTTHTRQIAYTRMPRALCAAPLDPTSRTCFAV
jgi:hypothetical protein